MNKSDIVQKIFHHKNISESPQDKGEAFAPTNIALCKYWGKRNTELNLPLTSSLSIALPEKGASTRLSLHDAQDDLIILNGKELAAESGFVTRLKHYLNLFREKILGICTLKLT